jgi:Transglycosylase-like domain
VVQEESGPKMGHFSVRALTNAELFQHRRMSFIGLPIVSTALAMLSIAAPISNNHHSIKHEKHHPGCNTKACDNRIDKLWWKLHHPKARISRSSITVLDLCVSNRENGEPGSLSYNTINWHAVNEYRGAYSFLHETWVAAGGLRYSYNANEASPEDQSIIFNEYWPNNESAWPNTLGPCLQYQ